MEFELDVLAFCACAILITAALFWLDVVRPRRRNAKLRRQDWKRLLRDDMGWRLRWRYWRDVIRPTRTLRLTDQTRPSNGIDSVATPKRERPN